MDKNSNIKEAYVYPTLATLGTKTETMDCSNNSFIAVTAAGTIIGTYVSEVVKKELESDNDFLIFDNIGIIASKDTDEPLRAIFLKDVTLISSNGIKNYFKYLYLFIDDIIALSFGNIAVD